MRGARSGFGQGDGRFPRRRRAAAAACLLGLGLVAPAASCSHAADPPPRARPANSLAGQLLVATETMGDPRFRETVIYMVQHDAGGAMGVVVNRPLGDLPVAVLLERLGLDPEDAKGRMPVHYGGPVDPGRGFVLHSTELMPEGSERVSEDVAVTARPEMLRAVGRGEGPKRHLFALGYAGWAPGQLEAELARAGWFAIPAETDLVFAENPAASWRRAIELRAIEL